MAWSLEYGLQGIHGLRKDLLNLTQRVLTQLLVQKGLLACGRLLAKSRLFHGRSARLKTIACRVGAGQTNTT